MSIDDFVTAIANSTRPRLGHFGITIKLPELPTWPAYRDARRRVYGTHRLSRFWMRRVFPWLRSREYTRRVEAFRQAERTYKQEFLNAVLEQAERNMEEAH